MVLRMCEYDAQIIFQHGVERLKDIKKIRLDIPRSVIMYLTHTRYTPDRENLEIALPNGEMWKYSIPTLKVQNYGVEEIAEKELYLLIPLTSISYYSKEEKICLEINVDELEESICDFIVYFNAFDENNNNTTNTMKVKLREFEGPNIICSDEITISLNEVVDFMSMVSVVDEYDLDAYKRLEIDYGDFDCNKSGVYYIKFTCFNNSGIYSEKTIKVIVETNDLNAATAEDKLLQIISTQPLVIIFTIILLFIFLVIGILLLKKNKYLSTRD